jgi:hypothetical protein
MLKIYNCPNSVLLYNALKDVIPKPWQKILKDQPILADTPVKQEKPEIKTQQGIVQLKNISNQTLYWIMINKIKTEPVTKKKWTNELGITDNEWKHIFQNNKVVRQTKIQALQYKILFKLTPCNLYLHKIGKSNTSTCKNCNEQDDIIHYFSDCNVCKSFWNAINKWWNNIHDCHFNITRKDIMVGSTSKYKYSDTLNAVIMYAKWYIYTEKLAENTPFLYKFLCILKYHLRIEKTIHTRKNKQQIYEKMWSEIELAIT